MIYIFDTNSFHVLDNYYPSRFPTFWDLFENKVSAGDIISVKEVYNELMGPGNSNFLKNWAKRNKSIFLKPSNKELEIVTQILSVPNFQYLIPKKSSLKGTPVADPLIIASAKHRGATVVTEEIRKPNAARIPNVCDHFSVQCKNMEEFLTTENWSF